MKHHHKSKDETNHSAHLEEMFEHPQLYFSLEDSLFIMREARFYQRHRDQYNIVAEPDITIFLPHSKQIYLVEYKCRDHNRPKANHQLGVEEMLLNSYFNQYKIKKFYVHNNFEEEVWK